MFTTATKQTKTPPHPLYDDKFSASSKTGVGGTQRSVLIVWVISY